MKRAELERWLRSHGAEPVPGRSRGGHEAWRLRQRVDELNAAAGQEGGDAQGEAGAA